jgi:predicted lipid-binding transport protein (Tim44 family)
MRQAMRRSSFALAAVAAFCFALAPGLADARVGGGGSFGSRGSQTWSAPPSTGTAPYSAQPMQRSMTPNNPSPGYGSGFGTAAPQRSWGGGFGSGLLGGLVGVGLGSLLFGHGMGGFGMFGLLGLLFRILIIVLIVRFVIRLFRGPSPAVAGGANFFSPGPSPNQPPAPPSGGGRPGLRPVNISPDDYREFEQSLQAIQAAWSAQDLAALGAMVTPEMLSYFSEQLAEQTSRGVRNTVNEVRLLKGDLAQAWNERGRDYATVAMRFSMVDVTRDAAGRVVDGSPTEHLTVTELWTFVRVSGGNWILSAIQQAR